VRLSEFWLAMADEFGDAYGHVLARDLTLAPIGGITAEQAIKAGIPMREVWLAICEVQDVPANRRYGVGQREPKK
jgi:hypothetical protein